MKKLLFILIAMSIFNCGKPLRMEGFLAVKNGDIKVGNANANAYQGIKSGEVISSEKEEQLAQVQLKHPEIKTLIQASGIFSFQFNEKEPTRNNDIVIQLKRGNYEFSFEKEKKDSEVNIITPAMNAKVLFDKLPSGRFEISVEESGTTEIRAIKGRMEVKRQIPVGVNRIPEHVIKNSPEIQNIKNQWDKPIQVVDSSEGNLLRIEMADNLKYFENAGLAKVLTLPELLGIKPGEEEKIDSVKKEEIQKAVEKIYSDNGKYKEYIKNDLKKDVQFKVQTMDQKEFLKKIKEAEHLTFVDVTDVKDAKSLVDAVDKRNYSIKDNLFETLASIKGKSVDIIRLPDGREIKGIVFFDLTIDPNNYIIEDIDGNKTKYPKDLIKFKGR